MTFLMALALFGAQAEPAEPVNIPEPQAVRTMHEFTSCIVEARTGEVRSVLNMDFRTRTYRRRLIELGRSSPTCAPRWIGIGGLLFAGSLAEHLFLRTNRALDPADIAASPPRTPRNRMEGLADCVVRHSPVQARAVLDSAPTTAEEASALEALRPAVAACLQGADEARMNRPALRSLVALSLYHLARRRSDRS
jgi:hypothetical protein